jgi:hypothetical protein
LIEVAYVEVARLRKRANRRGHALVWPLALQGVDLFPRSRSVGREVQGYRWWAGLGAAVPASEFVRRDERKPSLPMRACHDGSSEPRVFGFGDHNSIAIGAPDRRPEERAMTGAVVHSQKGRDER